MAYISTTPGRLAVGLVVYFACLVGTAYVLITYTEWGAAILPVGGYEGLDLPNSADELVDAIRDGDTSLRTMDSGIEEALALAASLVGTVVLMLPITWVYMATKLSEGFRKSFVEALIVLPICATSIVLLIQESLALAFGLAALVAAVRFRVRLRDALDGIFVFAAICVGLASGVGYLGVGFVMTAFFCLAIVALWGTNYGSNPIDEAEQANKLAKLEQDMPRSRP